MALDKSLIAFKKLFSRPHTSDDKSLLANESLFVGFPSHNSFIFADELPETAPVSFYTPDVDNIVERVTLTGTYIPGTDTPTGYHAFQFKLPDDYESISANTKAGDGAYVNGKYLTTTTGSLQIVSQLFGTHFTYELRDSLGNVIPPLDTREWILYEFGGIIYQQTPPGTGDHVNNPKYLDCYIYVGTMASAFQGSGGGGLINHVFTKTTVNSTNSVTVGQVIFDGAASGSNVFFKTVAGNSTPTGTGSIRLFNVNAGGYVDINGPGNNTINVFGSTSTLISKVLNGGTVNFSTDAQTIYELHVSSSNSVNDFIVGGYTLLASGASSGGGGSGGGGKPGSGADVSASYVVLSTTSSLPNERVLAGGNLIQITDNGPGAAVEIASTLPSNLLQRFADVSASFITLNTTASLPNERTLVVGVGLALQDNGANGTVQISAPFVSSTFVTLNATANLPNERVLTAGSGISLNDTGTTIVISVSGSTGGGGGGPTILNHSFTRTVVSSASTMVGQVIFEGSATGTDTIFKVLGNNSAVVSTGSIRLFNATNGNYVDINGVGVTTINIFGMTSTLIQKTLNSSTANFSTSSNTIYELHASSSTVGSDLIIGGYSLISSGSSTGGGGGTTYSASNVLPTGYTIFSGSSGTNPTIFKFKTVEAGNNITITDTSASIIINSTGGGSGGGADISASYLVFNTTSSLPNERRLIAGPGVDFGDGGVNGDLRVSTPFVSSAFITLAVTSTLPNERALAAGSGISISDGGPGSFVTISITSASIFAEQFADVSASFITVGLTASLPNERRLIAGAGLVLSDSGPGNNIAFSAPFVSANYLVVGGNTSLLPNERSLAAGDGIAIIDNGANGTLVISSTLGVGQFADISASYVTVGLTSSLPNERRLVAGNGMVIIDQGPGGNIIISQSLNVSSAFVMVGGIGNYPGQRGLAAGPGINITDGGAGNNVTISVISSSDIYADRSASYLVLSGTSSLLNERVFTAGQDMFFSDGGPGGLFTVNAIQYSGTNVGGQVPLYGGLSGSTTKTLLFKTLEAGTNINIVDTGNTIIISNTATGSGGGGSGSVESNTIIEAFESYNQFTVYKNIGSLFLRDGIISMSSSCYAGCQNGLDYLTVDLYRESSALVIATWHVTGQLTNTNLTSSVIIPSSDWYTVRFKLNNGVDTGLFRGLKLIYQ